jgi:hypothetical protein
VNIRPCLLLSFGLFIAKQMMNFYSIVVHCNEYQDEVLVLIQYRMNKFVEYATHAQFILDTTLEIIGIFLVN